MIVCALHKASYCVHSVCHGQAPTDMGSETEQCAGLDTRIA